MSTPHHGPAARRRAARERLLRRRRLLAGVAGLAVLAVAIVLLAGGAGGKGGVVDTSQRGVPRARVRARGTSRLANTPTSNTPTALTVSQTGVLPAPVQDAAAAAAPGPNRFLVMGGIDQGEASVADILEADPTGAKRIGTLPHALHDASASTLGTTGTLGTTSAPRTSGTLRTSGALGAPVYLFGGGVVSSFPQITKIDPTGATSPAGRLLTPASDVATAAIDGTVYIVGGYTGVAPLRTILAWRPGATARVVATLPKPLRYAAVAACLGKLVIAGGTSGEEASRNIYRFDPASGTLVQIGLLPRPLTHAAAAALGGTAYVFGGREASPTSQTRHILAIEASGKVRKAGLLPKAESDLAVVALGESVILAGGRDGAGAVQSTILTAKPS